MTEEQAKLINLQTEIEELEKRIVLLERVFGRLMQFDLRLDNLEFHSGQPIKPALNETIFDLKLRIDAVENQLGIVKENIRSDD